MFKLALIVFSGACMLSVPSYAQGINFSSSGEGAIEVTAADGIELYQKENKIIARKKALAVRGNSKLSADTIEAEYRQSSGKGTEIWRLMAINNVVMTSEKEKALGDTAEFTIDNGLLVIKGAPARFVTPEDVVTADVLEYWQNQNLVIAKENAKIVRENRMISADVISALFKKNKEGKMEIEKMQADGNVLIKTENEQASGERATYNPKTGIAILLGKVKLTQKDNYMTGAKAVVNMKTGISKLYATAPELGENKNARVKGVFLPEDAKKSKKEVDSK